jgi:hypothetical protein
MLVVYLELVALNFYFKFKSDLFCRISRELTLEHCAMQIIPSGAFSGLGGLQRLRILGEAAESDTGPPPSLQPDTFRQLSGLASLDLTGNGLASLPRGTFCHVANLRSLNLSRNSINQLTDIGKRKKSRNLDKVFFLNHVFPLGGGGECCAVPLCALPQEMDYGAGGGRGGMWRK